MDVINEIYGYMKEKLNLSIKSNHDCMELFCSFLKSLTTEMKTEVDKYKKVLSLHEELKIFSDVSGQKV